MLKYVSTLGGAPAVDFEAAVLAGYAPDGGLYVPESLPSFTSAQLAEWKNLSYVDLAFEILSHFIDRSILNEDELREILRTAYASFERESIIPIYSLKTREQAYLMELFYGPTISFKDVGMAFIVTLVNFFLKRKNTRQSIIVATTGDTGPAAAHFIAGKSNLDAWVLYPEGMITEQQRRQMTTLYYSNVHAVGVDNCPEGGDDLDAVIEQLYADDHFRTKLHLSSVNSLNWARVMMQTVHYFYGYFRIVDQVGEKINYVVPSGGFGNLCAGGLARKMGLPAERLVVANNRNACLHRVFSQGVLKREPLEETSSSAIDILVPINLWRYMYFALNADTDKISRLKAKFDSEGSVQFDEETAQRCSEGFLSFSTNDEHVLAKIAQVHREEQYLLDPHGAVAMVAEDEFQAEIESRKTIYLLTAHPAKFPDIIKHALQIDAIPESGKHYSIEQQRMLCERGYKCNITQLYESLKSTMEMHWDINRRG